ncbi:MAG TPA: hypothetical protein VML53_07170 [Thermoplasmata archaeon]|nr:hypothetical protein [Thermoplasmata archaeon]
MMPRVRGRWIAPAIAAAVILVSTGVGFAAFTGTATVNAQATAASFGLVVTSVTLVGAPSYVTLQTTALPSALVTAWLNNTPPDMTFNISVVVKNIGSVPATNVAWGFSTSFHGPATCSVGAYSGVPAANDPAFDTLNPGVSFDSFWTLHSGNFPARCAGVEWASFTITYTGSAGV